MIDTKREEARESVVNGDRRELTKVRARPAAGTPVGAHAGDVPRRRDHRHPIPLATPGSSVLGVVYSRLVAEEEVHEVARDGKMEQQASFRTTSAEGPVATGDYLLIAVLGTAQVKAEALSRGIVPCKLLAVSAAGLATSAAAAEIDSLAYYPPGSILGTAMEPRDIEDVAYAPGCHV